MATIKERLDNLRNHIQQPEFLEGKGLSNEVNIRIFCYPASDEMVVRQFIEQVTTDQTIACHLVECNLYKTYLSQMPSLTWKKAMERPFCWSNFILLSARVSSSRKYSTSRINRETFFS